MRQGKPPESAGELMLYIFCVGVFITSSVIALVSTSILDAESVSVSNVPINYVLHGDWTYPFHAQELFYPGVQKFMIHPPLHYYLVSIWIHLFGIGPWQLLLQSTLVGILGAVTASYLLRRELGGFAAVLALILATVFAGLRHTMVSVRPDLTFGLFLAIVVSLSFLLLRNYKEAKGCVLSGVLGFSVVASLATHWYGFYCGIYVPTIAAFLIWKLGKEAWKPLLALVLGGLACLAVWWWAIGNELWMSALLAVIKGEKFRDVLHIPLSSYLRFLTEWPGGWLVAIGMILAVGLSAFAWFRRVTKDTPLSKSAEIASFIAVNVLLYEVFFTIFVANKAPRYSANIAILIIPLSAIGYAWAGGILGRLLMGRRLVFETLAVMLGCGVLLMSPFINKYLSWEGMSGLAKESLHASMRKGLSCLVPKSATVLQGSTAYQYLYDRPLLSTMRLFAEAAIPQPTDLSLKSLVGYYREKTTNAYRTASISYETRRETIGNRAEAMVNADDGHGWQSLYYAPTVWDGKFEELASVGLINPDGYWDVTGRISRFPTTFVTVFLANDDYESLVQKSDCSDIAAGIHRIGQNVVLLRYDRDMQERRMMLGDSWRALDEDGRRSHVMRYLDRLAGSVDGGKTHLQTGAVDSVVDWVDDQFAHRTETVSDGHDGKSIRTFGQIVDRYFEQYGFLGVFTDETWTSAMVGK